MFSLPQAFQKLEKAERNLLFMVHVPASCEQALQKEKIRGGAEALFGAAVDEYRFHSDPSNSERSERKITSELE